MRLIGTEHVENKRYYYYIIIIIIIIIIISQNVKLYLAYTEYKRNQV